MRKARLTVLWTRSDGQKDFVRGTLAGELSLDCRRFILRRILRSFKEQTTKPHPLYLELAEGGHVSCVKTRRRRHDHPRVSALSIPARARSPSRTLPRSTRSAPAILNFLTSAV